MNFDAVLTLTSPTFDSQKAHALKRDCEHIVNTNPGRSMSAYWQSIQTLLLERGLPFHIYRAVFVLLFPDWPTHPDAAPAWIPDESIIKNAPITHYLKAHGLDSVKACHDFSRTPDQAFWKTMLSTLAIQFDHPPSAIIDDTKGPLHPVWLPDASLNIVKSCFQAPGNQIAIIDDDGQHHLKTLTYDELNALSNRVASGLVERGYLPGDRLAIIMPMNANAVAIYLGVIKMGGVVVSIADSFSGEEIAKRLDISHTKAVFTQDQFLRGGKAIPLYPRIKSACTLPIILLPNSETFSFPLRAGDLAWTDFLAKHDAFTPVSRSPMDPINLLFSSGTTGTPKAIAWNHTTPLKIGSDAFFHQGITATDILCWPTNLGWMMGPWLIFASLLRQATMALYTDVPKSREFGQFVERAGVTMLGVVPTLVASWRESRCMEGLHWDKLKAFSSTGECSNPEDMFYLMWLGQAKPVIEYCGGTEIGGAYLSSTLIEPNYPALFSTPAMGNAVGALNAQGELSLAGEVCLFPPAMGLSLSLENADHFEVYYKGMPEINHCPLRRHGDELKTYANGYYSIQGRVDDAMNLGGIKVSAADIERVLIGIPGVKETGAIAYTPKDQTLSLLVIFAITNSSAIKMDLQREMQYRINTRLNPLFKIHDVILLDELPKTASNKIMRRELRANYPHLIENQ